MVAAIRPYLPTALLAVLIVYFGFHAVTGDRGLVTGGRREVALTARAALLEQLKAERATLEADVRLLSNDNLSRDLLEERARLLLGYADPHDYIVRLPPPQPAPKP